ncbi:MAG: Lrp/AsnC family transcriptional regulator [Actinomycetota bacterium]
MPERPVKHVDAIGRAILRELAVDGRLSMRELGERVGLSPPATTERVRRLERDGVICGYRAIVDPDAFGYPMLVVIRVHSAGPRATEIDRLAKETPEVVECHRVTGSESHVIRVRVRDVDHLNDIVERFWEYGDTITNVVTTTPVVLRDVPFEPSAP